QTMPEATFVFLAPPSWEELVRRLIGRDTETQHEQQRRLGTARLELAAEPEFDAVIVNDTVEEASARLVEVMQLSAQRLRGQTITTSTMPGRSGETTGESVTEQHTEGIVNPPLDEVLEKVDSKCALVLFAAHRARQINAYFFQLHEGLFEYVGR